MIRNLLGKFKTDIIAFVAYIFATPLLLMIWVPCTLPGNPNPYTYQVCNSILLLDRFLVLAVIGISAVILRRLCVKRFNLKQILALTAILGIISVVAYYIYIPVSQLQMNGVEILLGGGFDR